MEPMDTSSAPLFEAAAGNIMRYEVVSAAAPRSEAMISGAVGGFTISAPQQTVPTYVQVPTPGALTLRPNNPAQSDTAEDNVPGFTLSDFLSQLEDYVSSVPDSIANHYLHAAGFGGSDPRMSRLVSLASQKFISDIINEAFTHCKLKGSTPAGKGNKKQEKKFVLTMEDLAPILNDYGIALKKPMYYT